MTQAPLTNDFQKWLQGFIVHERANQDILTVRLSYVDLTGDLIAGLILSELVYWHLPEKKTGRSRLRVLKKGFYWVAIPRTEWQERCRISPKQADKAIKILLNFKLNGEPCPLIVKEIFRFNGSPTVHLRLAEGFKKAFEQAGEALLIAEELPEYEDGSSPANFPERIKIVEEQDDFAGEESGKDFNNHASSDLCETRVSSFVGDVVGAAVVDVKLFPKGKDGYSPKVKMDFPQRSKTGDFPSATRFSDLICELWGCRAIPDRNYRFKMGVESDLRDACAEFGTSAILDYFQNWSEQKKAGKRDVHDVRSAKSLVRILCGFAGEMRLRERTIQ